MNIGGTEFFGDITVIVGTQIMVNNEITCAYNIQRHKTEVMDTGNEDLKLNIRKQENE